MHLQAVSKLPDHWYGCLGWNKYSDFGSLYSTYSVCNAYATDPPVIVDHEGNYYGRLTLNQYHAEIASGRQYIAWLEHTVCQ